MSEFLWRSPQTALCPDKRRRPSGRFCLEPDITPKTRYDPCYSVATTYIYVACQRLRALPAHAPPSRMSAVSVGTSESPWGTTAFTGWVLWGRGRGIGHSSRRPGGARAPRPYRGITQLTCWAGLLCESTALQQKPVLACALQRLRFHPSCLARLKNSCQYTLTSSSSAYFTPPRLLRSPPTRLALPTPSQPPHPQSDILGVRKVMHSQRCAKPRCPPTTQRPACGLHKPPRQTRTNRG